MINFHAILFSYILINHLEKQRYFSKFYNDKKRGGVEFLKIQTSLELSVSLSYLTGIEVSGIIKYLILVF